MALTMRPYSLVYTPPLGSRKKKKTLQASLGGDADARAWARWVVEQAGGGTASVKLSDGSVFTCP
jgi:hypothetical protein